ncbi:hypothetical protein TKK_0009802 [Trichogramma kaykai]
MSNNLQGDEPASLLVGTEVSAKYKGAFCEAKISRVIRHVKCKVTFKNGLGTTTIEDTDISGTIKVGALVEANHPTTKQSSEAIINKITDASQYTVVFDDGDITTLRRSALCLKSGRHFNESETLDQLPLTHPEHFGNPVIGARGRGRRSKPTLDDSEGEDDPQLQLQDDDDNSKSNNDSNFANKEDKETQPEAGKVVCIEALEKQKKKESWFPGVIVAPSAQTSIRYDHEREYLVRSFKDARYYSVPKDEVFDFTKDICNDDKLPAAIKGAIEKAWLFLEQKELPPHWDKHSIFGDSVSSENDDTEIDRQDEKSDEESLQQNDLFIAHLYKFMDDCNTPLDRYPDIEGEEVNFYKLYNAVSDLGGYAKVTTSNLWKKVTRTLKLRAGCSETACNQVQKVYKKYLANFEDIRKKLGCTMLLQTGTSTSTRGVGRKQKSARGLTKDKDRSTPPQTEKTLVKTEKDDEEKEKKPSQSIEEEKKRDAKKETVIKEEDSKIKKKEQVDDSASGGDSDINNEGEESSCSERSQKSMSRLTPCSTISNRSRTSRDTKETKRKLQQDKKKSEASKRQDKKEDKSKEEDNTKTRSKIAKDDSHGKLQKTNTEIRESRISTCDTDKKPLAGKQKKFTDEELKKRGRKKKEVETGKNLQSSEEDLTQHYKGPVAIGDRLKVIYGPNQDQKITYEAKVVDIENNIPDNPSYLVHYTGWNTRYDEWIKIDRIAVNYSQQGSGRSKKPNKDKNTPQTRPQTPGSTPRTSKVSASANTSSVPGMSSRRRIQNDSSTANSNKDSRKDDRETTLATTRSATPSPLISRTKSPASTGRPTRMTRNLTEVNEGRGSRKRLETDDSDSSDSDGSDSPVIPIKPRRRNCETREARKRAESRMKVDENSDIDEDKEIEEPRRGRRSRRTLAKITEIKSEPESETEQPKGCEFDLNQIRSELKGFDKAVKIEMSSTFTSQEQKEDEEDEEEKKSNIIKQEKSELDEKKASLDNDGKIFDKQETSTLSIKQDVVNTEAVPESTEDIYEFKEPEPFEFEVRNKRDSSGSDKPEKDSNKDLKDKSITASPASVVKKRPAEDELKSPKKRLKTPVTSSQSPAVATTTKDSKTDINRSATPVETIVPADAKKKTTRKIFNKSDDTESTEGEESLSLTSLSPTKFYPSTSYPGATVIRRHKISTEEEIGSSHHETSTESTKNKRLLLNKTTPIKNTADHKSEEQIVDETKKKSIKPKVLDLDKGNKETKEIPSFYIPAKVIETREEEQKPSVKKKTKTQDPSTVLETKKKQAVVRQPPTRKDRPSSEESDSSSDIESISTRDPTKYFSQYSGPKTKAAAAIASEYESLNNKVDTQSGEKRTEPVQSIEKSQSNATATVTKSSSVEQKSDYTMGNTPVPLTVPPPISARLPATATIEEKLSAAAVFHRRQMIESKKEEESKQDRKIAKEIPKKTHGVSFNATKKVEAKLTPEPEKKKVEAPLIIPIKDPLQEIEIHTDPLLEIMKSKEEELLKAKKSMEEQKPPINVIKTYQRKEPPSKPEESWKKVTSTTVISDQLAAVTSTGRKEPFVSRIKTLERSESVDSTDSSDSERRLTIIDEDYTDEAGPEQSKKSSHSEQSSSVTTNAQSDLQADIINTMMQTKLVTKMDEDGENINSLLCEEEIPGSPTPGADSHHEHQERSTSSSSQNVFKSDLGSKAAVAFVAAQLPLTIPSTTSVSTLVSSSLESLNAGNGKSITSIASNSPVSVLTTTSTSHLYVTTVVTTTTGSAPSPSHSHSNQRRDSNVEPMEVDVAPVVLDFNNSSITIQRVPTPSLSLDSDSKKDSMEVDNDAPSKSDNPSTSTENVSEDTKIKGAMKRTSSITSADEVENVSPKKRAKRTGVQQTSLSGSVKKSPRQNSKNRRSTTRSGTDDSDEEQATPQVPRYIRGVLTNTIVVPPRKLPEPTNYNKSPRKYSPEFDSNARIAYLNKQLSGTIKEYNEYKTVNIKVDRIRRKLKKKKSREGLKNKDDSEQSAPTQ